MAKIGMWAVGVGSLRRRLEDQLCKSLDGQIAVVVVVVIVFELWGLPYTPLLLLRLPRVPRIHRAPLRHRYRRLDFAFWSQYCYGSC